MVRIQRFLRTELVLGFPISALPFRQVVDLLLGWAKEGEGKMVCIANTHMLVEAHRNNEFADVLQQGSLLTPDGMPLVWMLRSMGVLHPERVAGPDLFVALCQRASAEGLSLFFLGSEQAILDRMHQRLEHEFPDLKIAGMLPLPFRPLTSAEDESVVNTLNSSGAGIVFVSLGCPKQEKWMAKHKEQVKLVMIGVGAAFPIYAGLQQRAPGWIQKNGFEWLFRLVQEPRRLWIRYGTTIPVFAWLALKQLLGTANLSQPLPARKRLTGSAIEVVLNNRK
ncbi:MAG: WecB/TagA/CpsF family glycosyltransferase [Aphanocapsa sp. GSE-SYN-MK-11-07L]|jgi:N-acetylglucosaminyldiphosphoundecaprenol N-acetyl-beta-D-mannosaminyltransferase|nr:WecB/TagA/CpsF family glycosyltransferase [Aphanocapsa sp. GSE-SYN-MK-11-07L]